MEGHAKKCAERYCELANKTTQQLYKLSIPCIDDHHFKKEELKSVWELSQECSQIVLKMPTFGTYWTWYSVVSEQTCKIDYEMDQKHVTNGYLVWSLAFIKWIQTILSWRKHCQTMQIGTVSRLRFCRRSWGFKNLHQVVHCVFPEATRLFHFAGCVRNKHQFRTAQRNQKSFLWMQVSGWTVHPHLIYGIWSLQFTETRVGVTKEGETCARTWFVQHLTQFKNERNLMEWSMIWTMLILFLQTSILLVRKLCCISLKTTMQSSKWS